jgi:hypothetical protein
MFNHEYGILDEKAVVLRCETVDQVQIFLLNINNIWTTCWAAVTRSVGYSIFSPNTP